MLNLFLCFLIKVIKIGGKTVFSVFHENNSAVRAGNFIEAEVTEEKRLIIFRIEKQIYRSLFEFILD